MIIYRRIKNKIQSIVKELRNKNIVDKIAEKILKSNNSKRAFLFQTPTHTNIGDHAIAEAQFSFFNDNLDEYDIFEINQSQLMYFIKKYKRVIKNNDIIFIHGGGNFGNEYMREENLRRLIIENFPKNKIILFPQTIYYSSDKVGELELDTTQKIFEKHENLILTAREEKSFELMKKYFPKNKVILVPDIVLYTKYSLNNSRDYALEVIRGDQESILTVEDKQIISQILKEKFEKVINSDMHCNKIIELDIKAARERILSNKLLQFSKAKIVITDRLHGMVLAIITGTPCIVFSNYNQKVLGTYNWIRYLKYIKFVRSAEEAKIAIEELLRINDYERYDPKDLKDLYKPLIMAVNE